MTDDEKKMTAYHEAGHAHRRACTSRLRIRSTRRRSSRAAARWAWSMRLPERDNYSYHRDKMYADLAIVDGRPRRRGSRSSAMTRCPRAPRATSSSATQARARDGHANGACPTSVGPLEYAEDEQSFLGHGGGPQRADVERDGAADRQRDQGAGRGGPQPRRRRC